jgi:hypothetical protein
MTTAAARTIIKDTGFEGPVIERVTASGTSIKPGHLLRITSANEFNVFATQGGDAPTLIALENNLAGDHESGGGVDKAYAAGEVCFAEFPPAGALRYARVPNGQTLVIGDAMIFNNAGQLIKTTGSPLKVVAWAEEAITTSGEQLVLVRIA